MFSPSDALIRSLELVTILPHCIRGDGNPSQVVTQGLTIMLSLNKTDGEDLTICSKKIPSPDGVTPLQLSEIFSLLAVISGAKSEPTAGDGCCRTLCCYFQVRSLMLNVVTTDYSGLEASTAYARGPHRTCYTTFSSDGARIS